VEFGEGLLNKGRAKKREKRPLTQIEIMAAVEREKQEKKAARRAAKVRASLPGNDALAESARNAGSVARDFPRFLPLGSWVFFPSRTLEGIAWRTKKRAFVFARGGAD
jgi:hypothetical protein